MNYNETIKWMKSIMENKIIVDEKILNYEKPIIGIYGIFVRNETKELCAYVGRSINIYSRMFKGDNAHLVKLRKGICENSVLNKAMENKNEKINVKVLEEVVFRYDSYCKDMQRLASRECYYIDYYQNMDQCLEQLPDGSNMEESDWLAMYEQNKERELNKG